MAAGVRIGAPAVVTCAFLGTFVLLAVPTESICVPREGAGYEWDDTHIPKYTQENGTGWEYFWNSTSGRVRYPVMEMFEQQQQHTCPPAHLSAEYIDAVWAKNGYATQTSRVREKRAEGEHN
eukprot:545798-Pyramimonas_sp.AAC.1